MYMYCFNEFIHLKLSSISANGFTGNIIIDVNLSIDISVTG